MQIDAARALVFAVVLSGLPFCGACSSWRAGRSEEIGASLLKASAPDTTATSSPPPSVTPEAASPPNEPLFAPPGLLAFDSEIEFSPDDRLSRCQRVREAFCDDLVRFRTDCRQFYSRRSMRDLLAGIGGGSILAHTAMDQNFRNWYQDDVRSSGLDHCSDFVRPLGDGWYTIPACIGLGIAGTMAEETAWGSTLGEFGGRAARAYGVGAPPMVFFQWTLGASRPEETRHGSRWQPYEDNNAVSGHTFIGAVPFITAAKMTDDPCLKGGFYFCSVLTGWSRVNDDGHYLSQVMLGWWLAYLACEAVATTDEEAGPFSLTPVAMADGVGIGVVYER